MNIFWPEGLQKLADSGEITFKDGERLNLSVLRKMDNGLYLINLKGKSFTATLPSEPQSKMVRAEVVRSETGKLELRIIPKAENSANPMKVTVQTVQTQAGAQIAQTAQPGTQQQTSIQKLIFQLPAGTIDVKQGEKVPIQILKTLDNGNTMVAIKNNLFEVKIDTQLLKTLTAEVTKTDGLIELTVPKLPVENLNQNYVKQEVGTFDLEKIMKAFGKFQKVDIQNMTPESLKQAVKNSGLFLENKLLHGEDISGDEKARTYHNMDTPAKDGITKMQVTNMLLAGGLMTFLKTRDEEIDDTYMRMKKGGDGQNVLYISTSFSQLGDTLITIRNLGKYSDVTIKTEADISEKLKELEIENVRIHWYKYSDRDLEVMDVKKDIALNMGNFEVII